MSLHHYHPQVAQHFYDPGTKSRKERIEILIPKALVCDKLRYPYLYREDHANPNSDYFPAPNYSLDSVRNDIFRLDTIHMMDINHTKRDENEFLPIPDKIKRFSVVTDEEKSLVKDFERYPQSCAIMVANYRHRLHEHTAEG